VGQDGLLGICDRQGRLCFALALWNGRDPILKERLFGKPSRPLRSWGLFARRKYPQHGPSGDVLEREIDPVGGWVDDNGVG
jgi:hypothetical protein